MKQAFEITRIAEMQQVPDVNKIGAVEYAMPEKFLDSVSLEELKEAVAMKRLGQMLVNDENERGIEQKTIEDFVKNAKKG